MGFWTPRLFEKINVSGFHVHFIAENGHEGGHMMDFTLIEGGVAFEEKFEFNVILPDNDEY
ncbi:acetolactate decarboxylase [Bartonella tamiae]|uniref:Alpha-acetolactate decarboxylase n=1 Tax=Bartonella tamiae Th239 TaxID=1094558 RepID=J0QU71_9HYPH|nr:acetolactate decarboxylase [Bartonella tamiae]EJF89431.1 hypothetical protein ME5_01982 [Bartonella tamiae Th239]EJF92704.1 hypothetical protein MEG_01874 [Bartonella tamiae Th307]